MCFSPYERARMTSSKDCAAETSDASAQPCSCRDYFGVSFSSLLVGGVLSVITPTPLSVNT
jgi:hypothetical protein